MTLDDAANLERWEDPPYVGEFNRFGAPRRNNVRTAIAENGLITDQWGTLMVVADGKPAGTVSWRAVRYGPTAESTAWNIGINLIPEFRGQGLGGEAQRMLVEQLFRTTAANRIEAMTDLDNAPEQRALEKAGFVREGVLRRSQFRAGTWHDLVVYAVIRDDG